MKKESEPEKILQKILEETRYEKNRKFKGNYTEFLIRDALLKNNINISLPKVFIQGINSELDLIVLKKDINPNKMIYKPEDIKAVLEIKFRGACGIKALKPISNLFKQINNLNLNITFCYVVLSSNQNGIYDKRREDEGLKDVYYPLLERHGNNTNNHTSTDKFEKLIKKLL